MHVSKVDWVEEHSITHERENIPYTFFSLDSFEKRRYHAFRARHNDLEMTIGQIRSKGSEINPQERQEREKEVSNMFVELMKPHLALSELDAAACFAGYGKDKKTMIETPYYTLFEDKEPFDAALRAIYWFSTKDENLSCKTYLDYRSEGPAQKCPQRQLVYHLLKKAIEKERSDGINFPLVSFKGDFVYFASSEFAMLLMGLVKDILEKIGSHAMQELNVLYTEYIKAKSQGEFSDTVVQQKVFQEAYERKVETELVRAGFIEQKLTLIN